MFQHLKDINMTYLGHLRHAWRMGFMLFIHGLIPSIWTTKVSDEIIDHSNKCKDVIHEDVLHDGESWREGTLWERDKKD
jgi:hypothetical protein